MKKGNILQLAIIIAGIIIGFDAVQYLFEYLVRLVSWVIEGGYGSFFSSIATSCISLFLLALLSWILILRSEKIANFISEKTNTVIGTRISSNPFELLYVLIVLMGIYLLTTNSIELLTDLYKSFIAKASSTGMNGLLDQVDSTRPKWTFSIMKVILPGVLLLLAKPLAKYFAQHITESPLSIEEEADDINKDE